MPDRVMATAVQLAAFNRVAVAKQNRRLAAIGLDARGEHGQYVRAIQEIGDATKPLRLALGAIGRAGTIKAHELGVGGGVDLRLYNQRERLLRRRLDHKLVRRQIFWRQVQEHAVQLHAQRLEPIAVEYERSAGAPGRIWADGKGSPHNCCAQA